ncbi:hypothetical protein [Seonamhaeicola sp. ML3]|uniref:hypothetical protein n=1 Tax=Seonamhaeicola sp. ML3 TaxID=2937786 RepID=UPI00200CB42E|nr:hypothetical protein [Seonamhaeicola sp. ML3]
MFFTYGQENELRDYEHYESLNIGVGYNYSYSDSDSRKESYKLLEFSINKTSYGGRHGGGLLYGVGTEIGLDTENFTIGPKITGIFFYNIVVLGTEVVTYTDFNKLTLRVVPIFGIGSHRFRATINPHLVVINKSYQPINRALVSFVLNLKLNKKRL